MQTPPRLTDADLERLDDFLMSNAVAESAMDVSTLEGFFTALVIGPHMVPPSTWLPWVWDFESGQEDVAFASADQAREVIGMIMGLSNQIAETFQHDPEMFEPVFCRNVVWGAAEWCEGFLKATTLFNAEAWALLWTADAFKDVSHPQDGGLITPFLRLGEDTGWEITKDHGDAERWVAAIVPALVAIHAYWLARRPEPAEALVRPMRRTAPKVGRNDPCPCGSGKKYKHCCGRPQTLH